MKLVNIILSSILILGLSTLDGSAQKRRPVNQLNLMLDLSLSLMVKQLPDGVVTTNLPFLKKDGISLMVHFIALAQEQVKLAMAVILSMTRS